MAHIIQNIMKMLIDEPNSYVSLFLRDKKLYDRHIEIILFLLKQYPNSICSIDLSNNYLTDKSCIFFENFLYQNSNIKRLYLSNNKFTYSTFLHYFYIIFFFATIIIITIITVITIITIIIIIFNIIKLN